MTAHELENNSSLIEPVTKHAKQLTVLQLIETKTQDQLTEDW